MPAAFTNTSLTAAILIGISGVDDMHLAHKRCLLAGARIRGGDGFAYTVVNRQANVRLTVRQDMDGARATLQPTDRVIRIAKSRMRGFLPPNMVSIMRSNVT